MFGKAQRSLFKLSTNDRLHLDQVLTRQQDFVEHSRSCSSFADLDSLLSVDDFVRPASTTLYIEQGIPRLNLLNLRSLPLYGTVFSSLAESARHGWSLDGMLVANMRNTDFVRLLLYSRDGPSSPHFRFANLKISTLCPLTI